MLDKTVDQRKRLDQARADLETVERALSALASSKAEASKSAAAYAEWRADHDEKIGERERLSTLVEVLEAEVSAANGVEADAELRKRYAAKVAANAKLAARINSDLAKANAMMLALARDVARSAMEDRLMNRSLPDDLDPLVSADFLARGAPGLPAEVISSERIWLWTFAESGALVGDQDSVVDGGNGRGNVPHSDELAVLTKGQLPPLTKCIRKPFDQITMHPPKDAERLTPLWQIRLLDPHGPRVLFDGSDIFQPAEALAALERTVSAPRERPIEIELRPVASIRADASSNENDEE